MIIVERSGRMLQDSDEASNIEKADCAGWHRDYSESVEVRLIPIAVLKKLNRCRKHFAPIEPAEKGAPQSSLPHYCSLILIPEDPKRKCNPITCPVDCKQSG